MYKAKRTLIFVGMIAGLSSIAAACGADSVSTGAKDGKVIVTMKEWEFVPSADSAPAGSITLEAVNEGKEVHELVLFKTDLAPADLPVDEEGAVDERGAGLELIDEVEDVKPGETKSFVVDLKPGKYVMACNVVENGQRHFMNKMYKAFTVTE